MIGGILSLIHISYRLFKMLNHYNISFMNFFIFLCKLFFTKCHDYISECDDPTPANGSVSLSNGRTYGASAYVSCDSDYILIGSPLIECLNGSVWSSYPVCLRGISCCVLVDLNNIHLCINTQIQHTRHTSNIVLMDDDKDSKCCQNILGDRLLH